MSENQPIGEFGEPWVVKWDTGMLTGNGDVIGDICSDDLTPEEDEAYAARIVACVNACAGVPSEQLTPGLIQALRLRTHSL